MPPTTGNRIWQSCMLSRESFAKMHTISGLALLANHIDIRLKRNTEVESPNQKVGYDKC